MSDPTSDGATASPTPFAGPTAIGSPADRAVQILESFPDLDAERDRYIASLPTSIEPETRRWLEESFAMLSRTFPEIVEYLAASADHLAIDLMSFYRGVNASVFRDSVVVPGFAEVEGCSTAGARHPDVGAWLVKNRDSSEAIRRRQIIVEHIDPQWDGRAIAGVSDLASLMVSSSGINSAGLAAITTSVVLHSTPPGIFRSHLKDALLARCTTVEEALDIIGDVPHVGGTMSLADATGAVATIELAHTGAVITRDNGEGVVKTNHYDGPEQAQEAPTSRSGRFNSQCRLESMLSVMGRANKNAMRWPQFSDRLRREMANHEGDGAVCRHDAKSVTISTALFTTNPPSMLASQGPGCEGDWTYWKPSTTEKDG